MTECQVTSGHRCCATCAYWLGQRELRTWYNRVYLSDDKTKIYGKCTKHPGTNQQGGSACSQYEKWQALE